MHESDDTIKLIMDLAEASRLFKRVLVESHYKRKPKTPTLNDIKLWIYRVEGRHFDLERAIEEEGEE